ncbi:MAG: DUF2334 domain-containing protein [Candidatus Sumerlaeota bacterium]|nr:DUF2334 domain-containing protein [Candidatus Sumerlaeota bacterium]
MWTNGRRHGVAGRRRQSFSLAATFLALCSIGISADDGRIRVVFRYDDVSEVSSTEIERRLVGIFRARGIACTFAVVPFAMRKQGGSDRQEEAPLGDEKARFLREGIESGTVDVALHGHSHQYLPLSVTGGVHSEFISLPLGDQRQKIAEGKAYLKRVLGVEVRTFVPPNNAYDAQTLEALVDAGIPCLSAARDGETLPETTLKYLPTTLNSLYDLEAAVAMARKSRGGSRLVAVLLHEWAFTEFRRTDSSGHEYAARPMEFETFCGILDRLLEQKDVAIRSVAQCIEDSDDLSAKRLLANRPIECAPAWICAVFSRGVYLSTGEAQRARLRYWAATVLFYALVLAGAGAGAYGAARWVRRRSALVLGFGTVGTLLGLAAVVGWVFRDGRVHPRGAVAIVVSLGATAGLLAAAAPKRCRMSAQSAKTVQEHS